MSNTSAQIMAAAHSYARARAAADYTLGSVDADTFARSSERVARSMERLDSLIVAALPEGLSARAAYKLISDVTAQMETYIMNRRASHGPESSDDLRGALDALLAAR